MFDPIDPFYIGASLKVRNEYCKACGTNGLTWPLSETDQCKQELLALRKLARVVEKGKLITRVNGKPNSLYVLRQGVVKTYYFDPQGKERITGFYLPGDVFGLESFNSNNISYASEMLSAGEVYRIPYEKVYELSAQTPAFHRYLFQLLSYELFDARRMSILNGHCSADIRLAYFLLNMSARGEQHKQATPMINLPMSWIDVSNYLGLTPETVSRRLTRFQQAKWVEVQGKQVYILNVNALLELINGYAANAAGLQGKRSAA